MGFPHLIVNLSVTTHKYTPNVSANPTASEITYRQALNESVLSGATVDTDGTWSWTDGSVKPNAGTREYEATFTPNDSDNYETVTVNVNVTIKKYRPTITELPTLPEGITYGGTLSDITLTGGIVE